MSSKSPSLRHRVAEEVVKTTTTVTTTEVKPNTPPTVIRVSKNEFKRRDSRFDSLGSHRQQSEYRGFFNLISVFLCFFFVVTQTRNLLLQGTLVGLETTWRIFNRFDLFPAWLFMVCTSFSAVVLQKLILSRILPRWITSPARIMIQVIFILVNITIGFYQKWPVVQTAFFLAELLVLSMKIHSYIMTNREYDKEYEKHQQKIPMGKVEKNEDGSESSLDMVQYPDNVSFRNYLFYLLVPTLVYELNYPRSGKQRVSYVMEKFFTFIGLWAVMHVLVDVYITPVLEKTPHLTFLESISQLIIPFTAAYLLIFYIVFDVGCNGFAEITRFADREFYSDWWNSNSFDEFARKWNKPVHEFLLRHVYLESIKTYKMSKRNATLLTFLFSSIVHEFFMSYALRIFRPWLFFFQMGQIPLIYISNTPALKNNRFGNHFFWFGMILGPPLLSLLYAREFYLAHQ